MSLVILIVVLDLKINTTGEYISGILQLPFTETVKNRSKVLYFIHIYIYSYIFYMNKYIYILYIYS